MDFERIILHAKQRGCFFEVNSSPDRLDLSAENTRLVREAGIRLAISTDSRSTREYATIRYGIEQARRAGLEKNDVLNCQPLEALLKISLVLNVSPWRRLRTVKRGVKNRILTTLNGAEYAKAPG